jgi:hypothetical protein
MINLKSLAFLAAPLAAIAHEAGNAHQPGGQFVLSPSSKFTVRQSPFWSLNAEPTIGS